MPTVAYPPIHRPIANRLDRAYAFLAEAVERGQLPGAVLLVGRHGQTVAPRTFDRLHLDSPTPPIQTLRLQQS